MEINSERAKRKIFSSFHSYFHILVNFLFYFWGQMAPQLRGP